MSSRARTVALAASVALLVAFLPAAPASAAVPPTVAITAPSAGSVSPGTVSVTATGTTDSSVEQPTTMELLVDATDPATALAPPDPSLTFPCSATPCLASFSWDALAASHAPHVLAVRMTTSLLTVVISTVSVTVRDAPSVSVTSPASSTTPRLPGMVAVTAHGTSDATFETPTAIELLVDPADALTDPSPTGSGRVFTCSATPCDASLSWDASAVLHGSHVLVVRMTTALSTVVSTPTTVVIADAPSVSITSPTAGPVVGQVTVSVTARTDAALSDLPQSIGLSVGATTLGTVSCTPPGHTCSGSVPWDATALSGSFTIAAQLSTTTLASASATVGVTVSNPPPTVQLTAPSVGATVFGMTAIDVVASNDARLSDHPASITVTMDGSPTPVGTVTCPLPLAHNCSGSLSWDATGPSGPRTLTALVTTAGGRTASASVGVTVANPDPAVAITSPADGATVVGATSVAVSASTGSTLSDFPTSIAVTADGSTVGTVPCTPSQHLCSGSVPWDTTALSGAHSLSAVLTTTGGLSASASSGVTVANPAPTVGITTPGASSVVSGSVTVLASGSTDPRRSDLPSTFTLLVDGVAVSSVVCPSATHDCGVALTWSAAASAGPHTLVVTMTTTGGASATSAAVAVLAASSSRVVLTLPRIARAGATVVVTGRVVTTTDGQGVAGAVVTLTRRPAVGKASIVRVVTGPGGVFTSRSVARTNTGVTAVVASTAWLGSSRGATVLRAAAPMTCRVTTHRLAVGAVGRGACAVPGLPAGTRLALRYLVRGRLATLASGAAKGAAIPFAFGFPKAGTYQLRVDLLASKVYVATTSALILVVVR